MVGEVKKLGENLGIGLLTCSEAGGENLGYGSLNQNQRPKHANVLKKNKPKTHKWTCGVQITLMCRGHAESKGKRRTGFFLFFLYYWDMNTKLDRFTCT